MAKEKERKFLVKNTSYRLLATDRRELCQAYISTNPRATVRLRTEGQHALLTIKSRNEGDTRDEFEYSIPYPDASAMIATMAETAPLQKTRYIVPFGELVWEVDEFHGSLEGLVVAEVELPTDRPVDIEMPDFVGQDVTGNPEYYNSNLIRNGKPGN